MSDSPGRVEIGRVPRSDSSSAASGWRGLRLEHFPASSSGEFSVEYLTHHLALAVSGCANWRQQLGRQVSTTLVRRGVINFNPAGTRKKYLLESGCEFVVIQIEPLLISRLFEFGEIQSNAPELIHQFHARNACIRRLVLQLWNEYQSNDMASGICAEALGKQLAVYLLRNYSAGRDVCLPPSSSKLSPKRLQRAIDYIQANLTNDLTIADVVKDLSVSPSHFTHGFKGATGVTPHHYIVKQRIKQAELLLRTTDLSISQIAMMCGFSTPNYFSTTFLRFKGKTPSSMRR
jgi:AraC family transcriptional regulator